MNQPVLTVVLIQLLCIGVARADQSPFKAHTFPGRIEAENYDKGGEGISYHDVTAKNQGDARRLEEGVDTQWCMEDGDANICWIEKGEWLEYTFDVKTSGKYNVDFRVASPSGGAIQLQVEGSHISAETSFGGTGGWQKWETITLKDVELPAGRQTVQVNMLTSGFNFNYLNFRKESKPIYIGIVQVPGKVEAESYVVCHDTTKGNIGNGVRDGDADIEVCPDGGLAVAYVAEGEWLEYDIDVKKAGRYEIELRVASNTAEGAVQLQVDGSNKGPYTTFTSSGGWHNWRTVRVGAVYLKEGDQVLRVQMMKSDFNLDYITFRKLGCKGQLSSR